MNGSPFHTHSELVVSCAECAADAREPGDSSPVAGARLRDTTAAPLQPSGDTTYLTTAEELRRINAELAGGTRTSGLFRDHPGIQVLEKRPAENGGLEVHGHLKDATYVHAGRAPQRHGGVVY